jgi:predicted DNA-binding transcriptional regulator YafY
MAERDEKGASLEEICESIYEKTDRDSASKRMFNRDCKNLREMLNQKWSTDETQEAEPIGIEIAYDRKKKRYFLKGALFFMFPLRLNKEDAYIISSGIKLCKHFIREYSGTADKLSKELRRSIPGHVMDAGESLSDSLTMLMPVSKTGSGNTDALKIVLNAINNKRTLRLSGYEQMNGERIKDTITPYFLYFKYHSWYVWAASKSGDNKGRPFRLSRMSAIEMLDDGVDYVGIEEGTKAKMIRDLELDYHPAYNGGEIHVRLRITGSFIRPAVQTEWFKGQEIKFQNDDSIIFSVKLKGLEAITLWIMRALDCIEVLEPEELRNEIDRRVAEYMARKRTSEK